IWFVAPFIQNRDWRFLLRHGALSAVVGGVPFLSIKHHFANHPVDPFKVLLGSNFGYLSTPSTYFGGFDVYAEAVPAPEGFHLFNLFLLAGVLAIAWRRAELREVWWICDATIASLLPFFLLFGYRDEIRAFGVSSTCRFLKSQPVDAGSLLTRPGLLSPSSSSCLAAKSTLATFGLSVTRISSWPFGPLTVSTSALALVS